MKEFLIQPETLAYLGNNWGISKDNLSLLNNTKLGKGSNEEISKLKINGVLDSDSQPSKKYIPCFGALKDAKYRSVISMVGNGADFEIQSYEDKSGNKAIVLATSEGLEIYATPELEMFQTAISQYLGKSLIKSFDLKISDEFNIVIALAAVIDVSRKQFMKTFFEDKNQTIVCSLSDIESVFVDSINNGQYLTLYLKALSGLEKIDISQSIKHLEKTGYVKAVSGGWILSEEIAQIIQGWLSIENFVQIAITRKNTDGSLDQLNAWILQFGINDLIAIERKENTMMIRTISSEELFSLIEQSIDAKGILYIIPEPNIKEQFCSNCNKPIPKEAKFCGGCGQQVLR
jgi:hypothetical protein